MGSQAGELDAEVLIAGGGPVGLCLAFLLAEKGVSSIVLESESALNRDLRASTFHPPTLDMLEPFGIAADLLARGLPCPTWQIRMHPGGERAVFDMSVLANDTRHPFRLQCEQWKLSEALLLRLARSGNAEIRWGRKLERFTQDEAGVTAGAGRWRDPARALSHRL
jgi:2-polyprenyl-6-methoxyphenol hydroxylase-like FAD-dependent oxidoreductase